MGKWLAASGTGIGLPGRTVRGQDFQVLKELYDLASVIYRTVRVQTQAAPIVRPRFHKIVAPDVIPVLGPQASVGAIMKPQSAPRLLFHRNVQALPSPNPLQPILANPSTGLRGNFGPAWCVPSINYVRPVVLGQTLASWSCEIAAMWRFTRNNGITEDFHTKMEIMPDFLNPMRQYHHRSLLSLSRADSEGTRDRDFRIVQCGGLRNCHADLAR
jgi:hypothetical protein